MKAISLWQPWASALFTPLKTNETRRWRFPVHLTGGRIYIHAAKKRDGDVAEFWRSLDLDEIANFALIGVHHFDDLPFGCLIGTAILGGCVRTEDARLAPGSAEWEWGNYEAGRFAWRLQHPVRLENPIPCIGRQGFFNVEVSHG